MKPLNFLSVRSAKETRDRQSRPGCARVINDVNDVPNTPNAGMLFGMPFGMPFGGWVAGRIVSPLTTVFIAASEAARRMKRQTRLLCSILLMGMPALLLAGCAGGGDGEDRTPSTPLNLRAVSNIQTIVGDDHILVGWTNPKQENIPAQDNITGFSITWSNVANETDNRAIPLHSTQTDGLLTPDEELLMPGKRVIYNITGPTKGNTYRIMLAVIYEKASPQSLSVQSDKDVGSNIDADDVDNKFDPFPTDACASTDTDGDGMPDSLVPGCITSLNEDPDDDNDGIEDGDDDFPIDACASADTDKDGMPNSLAAGCDTSLTEDPDDDNDGTGDDEDPFPTDACASADMDRDGRPDRLVPGCMTSLVPDPDGGTGVPAPPNPLPVSNVQTTASGNNITVSWTNPAQEGITGFNITWRNVDNLTDSGAKELNSSQANVAPLARVTDTITDLTYNTAYNITISVLYENGDSVDSNSVQNTTEPNQDSDIDSRSVSNIQTLVGEDHILAGWTNPVQESIAGFNITWFNVANLADNQTISLNSTQADGLLTPNDELLMSKSRVIYNITDLTPSATYKITITVLYENGTSVDSVPVRSTTGVDQSGGVGSDIDADGVPNTRDDCETGDTNWKSNPMTDNDGDGCRDDGVEDPDDDNDNVPDTTDVFRLDACASTDTDNDGDPDMLAANCITGVDTDLTADPDDDNDELADGTDNCRTVFNPEQDNNDTDGFGDACDVDDNNNGLIEIRTLDELARLRDDLNGDGTDDGNIDEITAVGSAGCPSSGCVGYELTRSLNFSQGVSYEANSGNPAIWTDRSGSGWEPIGFCSITPFTCTAYTAVFDGRDYIVADLFVSANHSTAGVGLFGAFTGRLQNLHLRDARVSGGFFGVGSLVGYGGNATYEYLSVTGGSVMSPLALGVGGLIGDGQDADIRYVYVTNADVAGKDDVGGLVGDGSFATIRYAYILEGNVTGLRSVTGLSLKIGGLVGDGRNADIRYVYASGGSVAGDDDVGGLVGDGSNGQIHYSYATPEIVPGPGDLGGLIGLAGGQIVVTATYWDTQTTGQPIGDSNLGDGKTTLELQSPTNFTAMDNIYALWGNFWCDPNTGNVTEDAAAAGPGAPFIRLWDLGTSFQYPVLNCMPGGLPAQGRADAFPEDACASIDTDQDGMPDTVVAGCQTNLTADPDNDNDGVNDFAGDGITPLDACPRGDMGWTSNASTDNDGDGCRDDSAEDPDDDNDGVADEEDAFPKDACASIDADKNGNPDVLAANCNTDLMADTDGADGDNDAVQNSEDNCPTVANPEQDDNDTDGFGDACDADDNNNGLIEIRTLDELARLRDDLNGDGTDDRNIGEIAAVGCPRSGCLGYELTRSLNFSLAESYESNGENSGNPAAWTTGSGWEPIGFCLVLTFSENGCSNIYTGVFDGGGYVVADLFVNASDDAYGVGLFGAFAGRLQNLHIRDARVSGGARYVGSLVGYGADARYENLSVTDSNVMSARFAYGVGGLAGYGKDARYENVSVTGGSVMSPSASGVGGLVGDGTGSNMSNAYASDGSVSGNNFVGGLIGVGEDTDIRYANVSGGDVSGEGTTTVGGLVGVGRNADIRYANVFGVTVSGNDHVGGLIGDGPNADIRRTNVFDLIVSGDDHVGGLVGSGPDANISNAYAFSGSVEGSNDRVGGLVGDGRNTDIRFANVSGGSVTGDDDVGGLVGYGQYADIRFAYVSDGSVVGNINVGGLVGDGQYADIRSDYVLGTDVSGGGATAVGGLVGDGQYADIRYAYSSGGSVAGNNRVGGLVGDGRNTGIRYAYSSAGSISGTKRRVGGLIGHANAQTTVSATYWDTQTTGLSSSDGDLGEGKSTTELQSPTGFTGIYASWSNFWCHPDTGEERTSSTQPTGFENIWSIGDSDQYPALHCMPGSLAAQRSESP